MNKNKIILLIISALLIVGGSLVYAYNSFAKPANTDIVDETVSEEEEAVEVIPNTKSISEVLAETKKLHRNKKLLDHKHMEDGNVGYLFYDEALNPDSNLFEMLVLTINTSNKSLETYGIDYK